jgi:Trp operon repressor
LHDISIYDALVPHVSKNKLSKNIEENLTKTLELALARISKEEEIKGFLLSLLSPTERLMLAKRLAIIILLREDLPDYKIAQTLNVTRETVSRIKMLSEIKGDGFKTAFIKLRNEKLMQDLKSILLDLAAYSVRAAGGRVNPRIF